MPRRLPFLPNRSSWSSRRRTVAGTVAGVIALALAGTACSPVEPASNYTGGSSQSAAGQDVFGASGPTDAEGRIQSVDAMFVARRIRRRAQVGHGALNGEGHEGVAESLGNED